MSFWNIYFDYMKKWLVSLLVITAVIISLGLLIVSFWIGVKWIILLTVIPILLVMIYVRKEKNRIAKEVYNQDSPMDVFYNRKEDFAAYLERKGIVEPHHFEYLIELTDKNAQDLKVPFLINWGIMAAIAAPIWIQYIHYIFSNEISGLEEATGTMGILIMFIVVMLYVGSIVRSFVVGELLNGEYNRMKQMGNLIRDIYLIKLSQGRNEWK
ncbi:hypothetical protein [Halobacillus naozhouensis]|uniref:ABC transmembrane type-1 domain-containing protein n=2 Tax=Halobacillus naozhouensis TaxID=554880 RepID=A0ABY8IZM2_9BACI|nr:hypothetical protein [Halobacillus naozhouensis]WFT75520.1 hypothetical protein P9989_03755 [Halobacillus naozhouensis]